MSPETAATDDVEATETDEVVEEVLVEEISIDGMCGVY
jgi:mycofactocin precursor